MGMENTENPTTTVTNVTGEDVPRLVGFDSGLGEDIERNWVGILWSNGICECRTFVEANAQDYEHLDDDVTGTLLFDRLEVHCQWAGSPDTPDHACWEDQ